VFFPVLSQIAVYALLAEYPSIKVAVFMYLVESLSLLKELYKRILAKECNHFSPFTIDKAQIRHAF